MLGLNKRPEGVKTPRQRRTVSTSGVWVEAEAILKKDDIRAVTSGAGGTPAVAGPGPEQSVLVHRLIRNVHEDGKFANVFKFLESD